QASPAQQVTWRNQLRTMRLVTPDGQRPVNLPSHQVRRGGCSCGGREDVSKPQAMTALELAEHPRDERAAQTPALQNQNCIRVCVHHTLPKLHSHALADEPSLTTS